MRNLLDAYDSLQTTWDRIKAYVLSHVVVGLLLFGIVGVTLPEIPLPQPDPNKVLEDPWFKLAKETNVLLLVPVVVAAIVLAYAAVLRTVGSFLVSLQLVMFPPHAQRWLAGNYPPVGGLTTLAMATGKDEFTEADLSDMNSRLAQKYSVANKSEFHEVFESLNAPTRSASTYWAIASFFLVVWIGLFAFLPSGAAWRVANDGRFLPGLLTLMAVALWARWRFLSWLPFAQTFLVLATAQLASKDPELKDVLAAAEPRRQRIETRVYALIDEALEADRPPRLFDYLWGLIPRPRRHHFREYRDKGVLHRGREFAHTHRDVEHDPERWILGWVAYRVAAVVDGIRSTGRLIGALLRHLVRGP